MLTARFLGHFQLQIADENIENQVTGRVAALLAYLAITRQPQPRTHLAELLWDNVSEQQARSNLRYCLRNLRKALSNYVVVHGDIITLNDDLPHWVDVSAFSHHMTTPLGLNGRDAEQVLLLQEALNLYTDEFLTGFYVNDASNFMRWLLAQRRHLHALFIRGLQLRVQQHLDRREYEEGLELNHVLLTLEPWREEAHRQRMLLFAYTSQRSAALQQYNLCHQILQDELDVSPMDETTTLFEEIKSGRWFARQQTFGHRHYISAAVPSYAKNPLANRQEDERPVPQHNRTGVAKPNGELQSPTDMIQLNLGSMPQSAHFFGRKAELATIHSWIGQEKSPLVGIYGIGGQGKSALAAAFVQEIIDAQDTEVHGPIRMHGFSQIVWVSAHGVPSCSDMLLRLLGKLDAAHHGTSRSALTDNFDHLIERLFAILQERRCLIVFDGIETILDSQDSPGHLPYGYHHADPGNYGIFFQLFFQRSHRSCLLLTSRIRPDALTSLDQKNGAFRCLELNGLGADDAMAILAAHGVVSKQRTFPPLHQRYAGNPLLLGRAASLIYDFFDGDVDAFLAQEQFFLGEISAAYGQQLQRLSPLERKMIEVLAKVEQPVDSRTLFRILINEDLTTPTDHGHYFSMLLRLHNAYLIRCEDSQVKLPHLLLIYMRAVMKSGR